MRVEMAEIGVQVKRLTIISIRKSYILVCNHPFLVGMFLFLLFLYRSFPFLFSLLVSTSPVVVCTFALLGFLLSLGDPNIPEIEKEESVNHEITSLRTEVQRDTTVVERDASFIVERFTGIETNDEESIPKSGIVDQSNGGLGSTGPLIEDYFTEIKSERREVERLDGDLVQDSDINERKNEETVFLENQYSRIEEMDEESFGLLDAKSPIGSPGSAIAEQGDSPSSTPWKQFGEGDDNLADDDSGSDSDRAESSSPDASMADILPMLDELHPLLNEETPLVTRGGSDHGSSASSHRSQGYREVPNDSDDESENHDDVDDEEEGDDEKGEDGKDGESKLEITWTEDDQKNLMDLGTLELERNQRLESLIARRRARKLMVEKNLIDLNFDLPFSVAPISTTRKNPFDLPSDSNEFPGLPPIPGSAPSIMSQRRNPFDLPYDSSEEKPDLTDDNFRQEFSPLPSREMMFRRRESFSVGPSIFAPPKHTRDDFRFRPYFVPEGSSHSSFQRQSSELSDISKVSSVPESDSICDLDDDKKILEEDLSQDVELGTDLEDPSELVGHGSESSEDEAVIELGQKEERVIDHDKREIDHSAAEIPSLSLSRTLSSIEEVHYSSGSSSSSLSEEHERAFDLKKDDVSSSLELDVDIIKEQAGEMKEPVYDLSPSSISKSSNLLLGQTSEKDNTIVSFSDREIDFCSEKVDINSIDTVKSEQIVDHDLTEDDEKLDLLKDGDQINEHDEDQISSSSLSLDNQHVKSLGQSELEAEHFISEDVVLQDHEELSEPPKENLKSMTEDQIGGLLLSEDHNLEQVHSQTLNSQNDASSSQVQELDCVEGDENETKEIDEWIMELDNISDFSIAKSVSSSNEVPLVEARSVEDIEATLLRTDPVPMKNEADINSGMLILQTEKVKSNVDMPSTRMEADYSEMGAGTEYKTVLESIHEDEIDSGMHELEATSIQDIDIAFGQIDAEYNVRSVDVESLPETDRAGSSEEMENKTVVKPIPEAEVDSEMQELEATSIRDIDTVFKQIIDEEVKKSLIIDSLNAKPWLVDSESDVAEKTQEFENRTVFEPVPEEVEFRMQDLETTSIQEIDTASRQISDEEIELLPGKNEADDAEISEVTENVTVFDEAINYGMHDLEATSIQDLDTAFRQIGNEDIDLIAEKNKADVAEITEDTLAVFQPLHEDIDPGMCELEATSIQDIDTAFTQIKSEETEKLVIVNSLGGEVLHVKDEAEVAESSEETESKTVFSPILEDKVVSAMHDLEATSFRDLDTAFKQINDEEIGTSLIVDSLRAEVLPEEIEADLDEISEETENKNVFQRIPDDEIGSAMHELEASSTEDISTAFRQINEEEIGKPVIAADSLPQKVENEVGEIGEETEDKIVSEQIVNDAIDSVIYELEVTSVQDITTAFTQINEKEIGKSVTAESLVADSLPEKNETEVAETSEETENKTVSEPVLVDESDAEIYELEASSIDDINAVFRRIKEEEIESYVMVESPNAKSLPGIIEAESSEIEAPEPPIGEARSIEATEKHSNIERFVTAVSDYFDPYIVEAEDKSEEEIDPEMLKLDSTYVQEIDEDSSQINEAENSDSLEPIHAGEIHSGMEQLEAESLEDLNSAFRQVKEEMENPTVFEPLKADTGAGVSEIDIPELPVVKSKSTEDDNLDITEADNQEEEISSTIVELDTESVKDIDTDIKEIENPTGLESMHGEERDSVVKEFEARSVEDLESAIKKIDEEAIETSVTVASLVTDLVPGKSEVGIAELERLEVENAAVSESILAETINLEKKDLEARSIENVGLTLRPMGNEVEKPVIVASLIADLATVENEALVSEIESQERPVVRASSIEDTDLSFNQDKKSRENSSPVSEITDPATETEYQEEEINTKRPEADLQSTDDIDVAITLIEEVEKAPGLEQICPERVDLEKKDFMARSPEDIDLTLRNIQKEEVEMPVDVASLVADLATEKIETNVSEIEAEDQISAFEPVHEDINSTPREFEKQEIGDPVVIESLESEISESGSAQNKPSLEETTKVEMPILEASSVAMCSSVEAESETKPVSFDGDSPDTEFKTQKDSNPETSINDVTSNLSDEKDKKKDKLRKSKSGSSSSSSSRSSSSSSSSSSDSD